MEQSLQSDDLTFLMVDMVGSTRSWEDEPEPTAEAIFAFRRLYGTMIASPACIDHRDQGDGLFAVFTDAPSAVAAARELDRSLREHEWQVSRPRFRMGIYTGEPHEITMGNYGRPANRCQRLMEVAHGDQILAAEKTVERLGGEVYRTFLGIHRLRDLTEAEPVYQLSEGDFPPIRSLESSARRLPRLRTETIGRREAIESLVADLRERALITLVGPGGVGKTRLALEVAAEATLSYARDTLADGLAFCDLATLSDPNALPEAVGTTLEIPRKLDQAAMEGVVAHLRHRRSLLVLDNCEHVIDGCVELVATLLAYCPGTVILATSRMPLGVSGERLFHVEPLSVPSLVASASDDGGHEAVELFMARAHDVRPELVADDRSLEAVVHICRQVDGLPLAIELVASRCRALSPVEIKVALEREPVTLPQGPLTALQRQRTIENTIAWSYGMLDDEAQHLLDIASVFAPDFELTALAAVSAPWIPPGRIARLVGVLADMSMMEALPRSEGTVLRVLETIRAFGRARLEQTGHADEVARHHADYYLEVAETAGRGMWTADEVEWCDRIARDLANLRDAASWARTHHHWPAALGIPCALRNFGHYRGHYEVFTWTEAAAMAARRSGHPLVADAFGNAGFGRWLGNDLEGAQELGEAGLAVEAEGGLAPSRQVRMTMMATALYQGDVDAAVRWGREFVRISDEMQVVWLQSMARSVSAIIELFHDVQYARNLASKGLAMADQLQNPSARCHALLAFGLIAATDDPDDAAKALAACVELSDVAGNQWTAGMSRVGLLRVQATLSDRDVVLGSACDLLRHWSKVGDWAQVWTTMQLVSALLAERGRDVEAVIIEAALARSNNGTAYYQDPTSQQHAALVAAARARLTAEAASAAQDLGSRLSERDIVEAILPVMEEELRLALS